MASLRPRFAGGFRPATVAQLDEASTVTPADIAHAAAQWQKDAPPAFRKLLDAKKVRPKRKPTPGRADSGGP